MSKANITKIGKVEHGVASRWEMDGSEMGPDDSPVGEGINRLGGYTIEELAKIAEEYDRDNEIRR